MVLNWSSLKKWRFATLCFLLCIIIVVIQLTYLQSVSSNNDISGIIKSLEEEVNKLKAKRFTVVAKEISKHLSNSSSKIRTVEDNAAEVSPTVQPEDTAGHIDSQMFRQRLKIRNGVKELWWHL